jgi:hypothetical protein
MPSSAAAACSRPCAVAKADAANSQTLRLGTFQRQRFFFESLARSHSVHGIPIVSVDIQIDPSHDLTCIRIQKLIRGLIMSGRICAIWMGTPCSSWSMVRNMPGGPPAMRNSWFPMGLENLGPRDRLHCGLGNKLMKFSAGVLLEVWLGCGRL